MYKKICALCRAEFTPRHPSCISCLDDKMNFAARRNEMFRGYRRRYAEKQQQRRRQKWKPRHCLACGKIFNGFPLAIYCSEKCAKNTYVAKHRTRRHAKRKQKQCVICGNSFLPKLGSPTITCSALCRAANTRERGRINSALFAQRMRRAGLIGLGFKERSCLICGDTFKPRSGYHLFCSDTCRTARRVEQGQQYRRYNAKWRAANPLKVKEMEERRAIRRYARGKAAVETLRAMGVDLDTYWEHRKIAMLALQKLGITI